MNQSSSKAPDALKALQTQFAGHIRDPENQAAPTGVEDRRMAIYRELFFNNIRQFLSGNFPVLRRLHDDDRWDSLVRDFFIEHRCQTPLFPELPREFLRYLQDGREPRDGDPPFMLELAHYEWVELALDLDEADFENLDADPTADLLQSVPVLSPLAWPLSYGWPVHQIGPDFQPDTPSQQPTHLVAWRDREHRVRFLQINDVSRLLLQRLQENSARHGQLLLEELARELGHSDPGKIVEHGAGLLNDWRDKDIVAGGRPAD